MSIEIDPCDCYYACLRLIRSPEAFGIQPPKAYGIQPFDMYFIKFKSSSKAELFASTMNLIGMSPLHHYGNSNSKCWALGHFELWERLGKCQRKNPYLARICQQVAKFVYNWDVPPITSSSYSQLDDWKRNLDPIRLREWLESCESVLRVDGDIVIAAAQRHEAEEAAYRKAKEAKEDKDYDMLLGMAMLINALGGNLRIP